MIELALVAFGMTAIFIEGKPTLPLRKLAVKLMGERIGGYFIKCYQCVGFWAGVLVGAIAYWGSWKQLTLFPFLASGISWALGSWVRSQVSISFITGGDRNEEGS